MNREKEIDLLKRLYKYGEEGLTIDSNIAYEIEKMIESLEAAKAESGEFTKEIRRVYGITNAKVDKKTPEHGNCCTCQRCGYDHDECKCLGNDLIELCDRLDAVTAELATVKELHKNEIFKLNDKCVSLRKAQAERIAELEKRPSNDCIGCHEPIEHNYCPRCKRLWES